MRTIKNGKNQRKSGSADGEGEETLFQVICITGCQVQKLERQILVQNGGKRVRQQCLLTCSEFCQRDFGYYYGEKNVFVDEDEEESRLFSDDNEEITSLDLYEPNFNEMKFRFSLAE